MRAALLVKISGEREDIAKTIAVLETGFAVSASSRLLKNDRDEAYFIFVDLKEKEGT